VRVPGTPGTSVCLGPRLLALLPLLCVNGAVVLWACAPSPLPQPSPAHRDGAGGTGGRRGLPGFDGRTRGGARGL